MFFGSVFAQCGRMGVDDCRVLESKDVIRSPIVFALHGQD